MEDKKYYVIIDKKGEISCHPAKFYNNLEDAQKDLEILRKQDSELYFEVLEVDGLFKSITEQVEESEK